MRSGFGILAVTGALLLSPSARAGDGKSAAPAGGEPKAVAESAAPREAPKNVMVARDPVTGELRAPTATEREALKALAKKALSRVGEPTVVETLPDGRVRARLGPDYARFSVARRNPDGTLAPECVPAGKVDTVTNASAPAASAATVK